MKWYSKGQLKTGLESVRGARGRNFWTMLGVIIGVASVITVVSIGEGIKAQIAGQIRHYGKDLITVQPEQLHGSGSSLGAGLLSATNVSSTLSQRDLGVVATSHGVAAYAPLSAVPGSVKADNGEYHGGLVIGTTADLLDLINQSTNYGVFLTAGDVGQNVAVIGAHAAAAMFNQDIPLGRTFSFRGQEFIVHGVLNEFDTTPFSQGADFNNAIFIPYDVGESLTRNAAPIYQILAKPGNAAQTTAAIAAIQNNLRKAHGGESDVTVSRQSQAVAGTGGVIDLLTRLIAGIAAISLFVGGVGIMNVMLLSVAERTHEIGIRKAVGATNRQILGQFMVEASILSLSGGVIGIIIALLIDVGLRLATDLQPVISWELIVLATGVSLAVGIIFGSVPALKAAKKDPIDALRGE